MQYKGITQSERVVGVTTLTLQIIEADRRWGSWMVAAQAGDRAAYETLLQDCIPFIKRVARRQGVSFDRIDDVVQDTLVTVHRARQTYDPSRSFSAWLRTIAQRRAIDGLRRHNRHQSREIYAPLAYENHADTGGDPRESTDRSDRIGLFCAAPWRPCRPGNLRPCSIWHCRGYRLPKPQRQLDARWGHSR